MKVVWRVARCPMTTCFRPNPARFHLHLFSANVKKEIDPWERNRLRRMKRKSLKKLQARTMIALTCSPPILIRNHHQSFSQSFVDSTRGVDLSTSSVDRPALPFGTRRAPQDRFLRYYYGNAIRVPQHNIPQSIPLSWKRLASNLRVESLSLDGIDTLWVRPCHSLSSRAASSPQPMTMWATSWSKGNASPRLDGRSMFPPRWNVSMPEASSSSQALSIHTSISICPSWELCQGGLCHGESRSLVGGTTTLIEMCCPSRTEDPWEAYQLWRSKAEGCSACDFTFHMAVTRLTIEPATNYAALSTQGLPVSKSFLPIAAFLESTMPSYFKFSSWQPIGESS